MQLHEARRADLTHKKKLRVGRGPGSGIGKTSGRGLKGATARSGYTMKATYEGGQMPFFRRLPKRGFRNGPFRVSYSVVNVSELAAFPAGTVVGKKELKEAGLISGPKPVKILGEGELSVALTITADRYSQSALQKIEKAGGKAEWVGGKPKKPAPNFKKIEAEKKKAAAAKAAAAPKPEGKKGGDGGQKPAGAPKAPKPPKEPKAEKPQEPKGEKPQEPNGEKPQEPKA